MITNLIMEKYGLVDCEEFKINGDKYRIKDGHLEHLNCFKTWVVSLIEVNAIMTIEVIPFKPKYGEQYWYISVNGFASKITCNNDINDLMFIHTGNCYRTKENALKDKDKWVSIFEGVINKNEYE